LAEKGRSLEAMPVTMEESALSARKRSPSWVSLPPSYGGRYPVQHQGRSGHPTSSLSAADLLAVLIARHLHCDWAETRGRANDHLIFSKGHASPLLYAVFKAVGAI
jgi:transketolase